MRMIRRSGLTGTRKYIEELWQKRVEQFLQTGGDFVYRAPTGPIDDAQYDDPHKPKPRRPVVDDDLEGWTPL